VSHYSMGGYRIAVMARSSKTLLVEGKDDRLVLQRIFLESVDGHTVGRSVRVDSADLVRDQAVEGIGARDKVSFLINNLAPLGQKLRGLIDREWDFFCTDTYREISGQAHGSLFVTKGHSIENYFFSPDICCSFLRFKYAHLVSVQLMAAIDGNFSKIVKFAFAYSVACRRLGLIDRLEKFISPRHLHWVTDFSCAATFGKEVERRGVKENEARRLMDLIDKVLSDIEDMQVDSLCGRWNAHGHLGEDAVWACIGRLAAADGVGEVDADSICHGHREDRLRSSAHNFASKIDADSVPFQSIIGWAQA
jgi:hypothetical protein